MFVYVEVEKVRIVETERVEMRLDPAPIARNKRHTNIERRDPRRSQFEKIYAPTPAKHVENTNC